MNIGKIKKSFYFVAVSTKENLEKCKKYSMAGFPDTINGAWAYTEIKKGDFITFLYGARAHNLYRVTDKKAIKNAKDAPPLWKPIESKAGKLFFPFRIYLEPLRKFNELLARHEFSYIAENLLLRGGYKKSHFEADQTTLSNISGIGNVFEGKMKHIDLSSYETFEPKFIRKMKKDNPEVKQFGEKILQSLIKHHFSQEENLQNFLYVFNLQISPSKLEILSEKAIEEGHIDLLIKEKHPSGRTKKLLIEVKLGKASKNDINQLGRYMDILGKECVGGALIAEQIPRKCLDYPDQRVPNVSFFEYGFKNKKIKEKPYTFNDLLSSVWVHHKGMPDGT